MRFVLLIATLALILLAGEVLLRIWLPLGAIVYRLDEQHLHEYTLSSRGVIKKSSKIRSGFSNEKCFFDANR